MLENPYQSPLADEGLRPNYTSRFQAARSGALQGGLSAAKWTAIIGGAALIMFLIFGVLINVYRVWRLGWQTEHVIALTMNIIGLLFVFMALLIMMILLTASTTAVAMAAREALRFRKASADTSAP